MIKGSGSGRPLTYQLIEGNNLLFQAQTNVVVVEEGRVLLFELLPHQQRKVRLNVGVC